MSEENKPEMKPCRVCKKQMDMNNKNAYITGMAGSMHFYVCSSGCLSEYYNPKNNTRADSKPEVDILTTALDVATAQRDDALAEVRALKIAHQTALEQRNRHGLDAKKAKAEVERLKTDLRSERDHGVDSVCKITDLNAEVETLRTALSNADEEIIVLSDQRNDAMAYVTSLKAEAILRATGKWQPKEPTMNEENKQE